MKNFEYKRNSQQVQGPKFYEKTWFIILMLIFISPVGIFLMWYFKEWNIEAKIIISIVFIIYFTIYCGVFF